MREEIIALFLFPFLLHGTGGSANKRQGGCRVETGLSWLAYPFKN